MPNYAAVGGREDFRTLAARFRAEGDVGKGLRKKLRRDIKVVVEPVRRSVQQAALDIPVKGPSSTGLRAAIAKATKASILMSGKGVQVRLQVTKSAMPQGQKNLPQLMEGMRGTWRHPVYGNKDVWVTQPTHPYFYKTVERDLPMVRGAVIAALEETSRAIGGKL